MDEYIDREAFLKAKREQYCADCSRRKNSKGKMVYDIGDVPCRACRIGDILDDVEDFPAADVVEVVRCKDCKNYIDSRCYSLHRGLNDWRSKEDYCSNGKRRIER